MATCRDDICTRLGDLPAIDDQTHVREICIYKLLANDQTDTLIHISGLGTATHFVILYEYVNELRNSVDKAKAGGYLNEALVTPDDIREHIEATVIQTFLENKAKGYFSRINHKLIYTPK